jgi:hypothetical protein
MMDNNKEITRAKRINADKIRDLNDYLDFMEAKRDKLKQDIMDENDEQYKEDMISQLQEIEHRIENALTELSRLEE